MILGMLYIVGILLHLFIIFPILINNVKSYKNINDEDESNIWLLLSIFWIVHFLIISIALFFKLFDKIYPKLIDYIGDIIIERKK